MPDLLAKIGVDSAKICVEIAIEGERKGCKRLSENVLVMPVGMALNLRVESRGMQKKTRF